ncbi:MAG TPA: M48 family metallopeptidase [Planococcus sp. (in: firmicutes)]|nr:M48 family metallopeptidase [Planococcus sp. (in: firmicutes)]
MNSSTIQSERETLYFVFSVLASLLVYALAAVSIFGIAVILVIFVIMLYANAMMLGSIRGNGVRIHERQFGDVYSRVQALSKEMELKKVPDVFVIQSEGALNAFATRFWGRDMVVLYSEVFELAREQGQAELDFIIAHELAHIKRRHVWKNLFILPAGFIPFLAQAYSRSCEYTCDRHAAYVIQNADAAKHALTLLGIGKKMYLEVNEEAYREQIETESNGIVWFSEVLSTHPHLPKRIQSIEQFSGNDSYLYKPNTGKIVLGAVLLTGVFTAVYIATILLFTGGGLVYSQLLPDDFSEESFLAVEGETLLMRESFNGDLAAVEAALADGEDIHAKDAGGADALMYAVQGGEAAIAERLIEAGAEVNTSDDYSTALETAVLYEDNGMARLLVENGADPLIMSPAGSTALEAMGASSEAEFMKMLKE